MLLKVVSALFLYLVLAEGKSIEPLTCATLTDEVMINHIFANKNHTLFKKTLERDTLDDFKTAAELIQHPEKNLEQRIDQLVGNVAEKEREQRQRDAASVLKMVADAGFYAGCNNLEGRDFPSRIYSLLFEEGFQRVNEASQREMIAEALGKAKQELQQTNRK